MAKWTVDKAGLEITYLNGISQSKRLFFIIVYRLSVKKNVSKRFMNLGNSIILKKNSICLIPIVFLISLLIGLRDKSVGTDTKHYENIFYGLIHSDRWLRYEPGFEFFIRFLGNISDEPKFLFVSVGLFITTIYLFAYKYIIFSYRKNDAFIFLSFLLLSSWFLTFTTNGIRQGMSLSLLYLAIGLLSRSKNKRFLLLVILSLSFHLSSLLAVPFVLFIRYLQKRRSLLVFLFIILSLGYLFGINELIVREISSFVGLPIYSLLKNYGGAEAKWVGFQADLYLYTNFWFFVSVFYWIFRPKDSKKIDIIIIVYAVLCLPYFVFGFGGYSNRIAQIAWFFIPILQSGIIQSLNINRKFKVFLFFLIFVFSLFYFSALMYFPYLY